MILELMPQTITRERPCTLRPPPRRVLSRQEHYDTSEALSCLLHSSIALHKDIEARPLSLEKCLDTFTAQEDIKEVGGGGGGGALGVF